MKNLSIVSVNYITKERKQIPLVAKVYKNAHKGSGVPVMENFVIGAFNELKCLNKDIEYGDIFDWLNNRCLILENDEKTIFHC